MTKSSTHKKFKKKNQKYFNQVEKSYCIMQEFLKAYNFIKRLQHSCFLVKFANFLRTPLLKNICKRLLP